MRSVSLFGLGVAATLASMAVWAQRPQPPSAQTVTVAATSSHSLDGLVTRVPLLPSVVLRDGMYKVGVDLRSGTYVTRGVGAACYFAVTTDLSGSLTSVVKTYFGDAFGRRVELEAGHYFETDECGTWTLETPPAFDAVP